MKPVLLITIVVVAMIGVMVPNVFAMDIASFVDQSKDPQHYIDRYYYEPEYKQWFDENYSQYDSIYEAVGENYLQDLIDKLPEDGLLIISIIENSGAEQAGLMEGDILVTINGKKIYFDGWESNYNFPTLTPGETSSVSILRDGQPLDFELTVMPAPNDPERGLIGIMRDSMPSKLFDMVQERKSIITKINSFSEIKLLEGQWAEYDFNMEFNSNDSQWKDEFELAMLMITWELDIPNPFEITKLRLNVVKVTDYTIQLNYDITDGENKVIRKTVIIHPDFTPGLFESSFIPLPAPKQIVFDDHENMMFIDMILDEDEYTVLKNIEIPTISYTGLHTSYDSKTYGSKTVTTNSKMNFDKVTGILFNTIRSSSFIESPESELKNISYHVSLDQSITDYYIPSQINKSEYTSEPIAEVTLTPNCGTGTELVNGICEIVKTEEKSSKGGGCLIATATYGSELSPQVQQLRELRDNQLLQTESGTAFMSTFNDIYYSFSPIIADYERENPMFKEAVKLAITPMISTLSIMENAETESEVLSIGISVIVLNLGMYLGVPAIVVVGIRKKF